MAFWQHAPPGVDARPVEIAHLFAECREAFFETADRFHWTPAPGSAAERATTDLPSPDPAVIKPRGETGHRLIGEVVQTYLLTASGHLGGLASLYASGEVFFPPAVLVRAVIENCAHVMWVLGDDPTEPSDARLARAYLEELLSAVEAKKAAGRLGDKSGSTYAQANDDYKALKVQILARFPGATTAELGDLVLLGQRMPKPEACVTWMYALLERDGGSTVGDRAALGVYGFLSNMTHPTLYPARQLREWATDAASGHRVAFLRLDTDFLNRQASAAVMAFYNALSFVTSYYGWSTSVHDDLTTKIDAKMPTLFA
jgi:hypothetical protein